MAQGTRPGGLTALAVVNFVFFGLSLLGLLTVVFLLNADPDEFEKDPAAQARIKLMQEHKQEVYTEMGLSVGVGVVLLLAGLGYIGQKRILGRWLGNLYGLAGLGLVAFQLTYVPFGIEHMMGFIYPVLTVALLNTTFRHDLVH